MFKLHRIEGNAIISEDGMLANGAGIMPDKNMVLPMDATHLQHLGSAGADRRRGLRLRHRPAFARCAS